MKRGPEIAEILYQELSYVIAGAAMEAHRTLGSRFLAAVYQTVLAHELTLRGVRFDQLKGTQFRLWFIRA